VADMIATGSAWFEGQWLAHLTTPVQFRAAAAGANAPWVSMSAALGMVETATVNASGVLVRVQTRTVTVSRSQMATDPKRGDQFQITENGEVVTMAVVSDPGTDRVWEWADRTTRLRQIYVTPVSRTAA